MKSALRIVMRNPEPKRERTFPGTWVVYMSGGSISVTIEHDSKDNPYVSSKDAA